MSRPGESHPNVRVGTIPGKALKHEKIGVTKAIEIAKMPIGTKNSGWKG